MLKHRRRHTDGLSISLYKNVAYECYFCRVNFQQFKELHQHMREHPLNSLASIESMYKCNQCSKRFIFQAQLDAHALMHDQQHLCAECGKTFRTKALLKAHQLWHRADQPYACAKCPLKFKTKTSFKRHLIVHVNERNFACDICGHTFKCPTSLKVHKSKLKVVGGH